MKYLNKRFYGVSQKLGTLQADVDALKCGLYRLVNSKATRPNDREEKRCLLQLPFQTTANFEKFENSLKQEKLKQQNELQNEIVSKLLLNFYLIILLYFFNNTILL